MHGTVGLKVKGTTCTQRGGGGDRFFSWARHGGEERGGNSQTEETGAHRKGRTRNRGQLGNGRTPNGNSWRMDTQKERKEEELRSKRRRGKLKGHKTGKSEQKEAQRTGGVRSEGEEKGVGVKSRETKTARRQEM